LKYNTLSLLLLL